MASHWHPLMARISPVCAIIAAEEAAAAAAAAATGPSSEVLIAVGAALPVLTYPFLPSARRPYNALGILLVWSSVLHIFVECFMIFINTVMWACGCDPLYRLPIWVIPSTLCTLMAGLDGLSARLKGREPQQEDFVGAAQVAWAIAVYEAFDHGIDIIDFLFAGQGTQVVSLHNVICTLVFTIMLFDVLFGSALVYERFVESAATVFYQFTTRRVLASREWRREGFPTDLEQSSVCLHIYLGADSVLGSMNGYRLTRDEKS